MCIFVVVHCAFNILVAHVFARYATTVHNDNKKILSRCDLTNCIENPPKSTKSAPTRPKVPPMGSWVDIDSQVSFNIYDMKYYIRYEHTVSFKGCLEPIK